MKWDENEHPRDKNGKFTSDVGGENSSPDTPMKKIGRLIDNKTGVMLSYREQVAVSSAIRTRYGNKIPPVNYFLYGDHMYLYRYNHNKESIRFTSRIQIDGNEEFIKQVGRYFDDID